MQVMLERDDEKRLLGTIELDDVYLEANTAEVNDVKNSIRGTYHAIRIKHAPRYLAGFEYRFNRRLKLEDMIPRLAYATVYTPPIPLRILTLAENPW